MATTPLADIDLSVEIVRSLIAQQCPELSGLGLAHLRGGWDNEIFRLGEELLVRLPRRAVASQLMANEQEWLPRLADRVMVDVPVPVFRGLPSPAFPHPWSIVPWLPGTVLAEVAVERRGDAAESMAEFFGALHLPAPPDAPANPFRGVPLESRRSVVAERLAGLHCFGKKAVSAWLRWSAAPAYQGPPRWLHGDPHPLNLLVDDRQQLVAVIDWGDLTAGDPATDLAVAWLAFDADARRRFVAGCQASGRYDEATWTRAKAWALALASAFIAQGDPALRPIALHARHELLG